MYGDLSVSSKLSFDFQYRKVEEGLIPFLKNLDLKIVLFITRWLYCMHTCMFNGARIPCL